MHHVLAAAAAQPLPLGRSALRTLLATGLCALALALPGCGSPPRAPVEVPARPAPRPTPALPTLPAQPSPDRDGPEANPPQDLHLVPDAEPRIEAVRQGGPNKPYEVMGQSYVPTLGDPAVLERGLASWYGRKFHGRRTSSGEVYDMYAMTAAHKTLPIPSYVRVRNPANGREIVVRVNDRGPFHGARVIDLSYTAALKLGVLAGVAPVELERITHDSIRTGAWRRSADDNALGLARPVTAPAGATLPATALPSAPALATARMQEPASPADDPIAEIALRDGRRVGDAGAAANAGAAGEARPQPPARGFWLQLGAFRQRDGATGLRRQVEAQADWLAPLLAIFNERDMHRLQAGPYANRDEAGAVAERLRQALRLAPVLLERR